MAFRNIDETLKDPDTEHLKKDISFGITFPHRPTLIAALSAFNFYNTKFEPSKPSWSWHIGPAVFNTTHGRISVKLWSRDNVPKEMWINWIACK